MSLEPKTNESLNIIPTIVSFFGNLGTNGNREEDLEWLKEYREMLSYESTVTDEERTEGLDALANTRFAISPDDVYAEEREKNLAYINDLNMNIRSWH